MNKEITYSFIIPHKNCPGLLQRCVDSIPERDDVQVIVVDDNSDEGKKPMVKREGVEVILLDEEHSKGAGRARNVGLELAKGKWLLFADADDYYNRGFLEVLDKYVNSDYEVVYFNCDFKDGETGEYLPTLRFKYYFDNFDGSKESVDQVKYHHNVPWTKMVNHNFLRQNNISFEESINGNDIYFSMKVGYCSKNIQVIKNEIYVYLRNSNSLVNRKHSIIEAFCRLRHRIELNFFYNYINHHEWNQSALLLFFQFAKRLGIPFVLYVMTKTISFRSQKRSLLRFVQENQYGSQ